MKNASMVKTASILGIAAIGLTAFGAVAMAQTAPALELTDVLNADMDQVIEINTNVAHPLGPVLEAMAGSLGLSNGDTAESTQLQVDALKTVLAKNKITIATKNVLITSNGYSYTQPDTYMSFHISAADLGSIGCTIHCATGTEQIAGVMVYAPEGTDGSKFITYLGDLLIMTSSRATMNNVINNYNSLSTAATLGKNAGYLEVRSKAIAGSFLNMYVNPAQYQNMADMTSSMEMLGLSAFMNAESDLMGAIKAEGISVSQTGTGFNFSIFVKGDSDKLTQLNLNFDRYNFIPGLYKYVNSNNIIMFGEENNLKAKISDFMKLFASDAETVKAFTDWKAQLKTDANIDFDTEILPILGGKYALSIHKTDQIWPAVTLLVDVSGQISLASSALNKMVTYADKIFTKMETDDGSDFYNRGVSYANGVAYYELTFDPTKSTNTDPEIASLAPEKVKINIHAAVTPEGFLVITSAPNVADVFTYDSKGMTNNATFNQAFTAGETLAGLGYFSIDNLQTYADMMMDTFSAPAEARTFFDGVLDPWHDIFTKGYATTDTASATGFVNVDTDGFAAYPDLFQNAFGSTYEDSVGSIPRPETSMITVNFCDVNDDDWFAAYVQDLHTGGVVNGYEDGCYHPERQITRAEFIKMAMEAAGLSSTPLKMEKPFKDVSDDGSEWYDNYVNAAAYDNLITGYSDGTFRPNNPVTRAEAVQILFNMSENLKGVNMEGNFDVFTDVHASDWFINPVHAAYAKGLVQGTSQYSFEPNRNINRAEASKIIKLFMDLETNAM